MRDLNVSYKGESYVIPEIWVAGWVNSHRSRGESVDTLDAIKHWHYQSQLAKRERDAMASSPA